LNKYRKPAGATVSRKLREARYTESLPKAPAGKYVVVQFDTVFEHKPDAVETVVEVLEADGRWEVSGYFIR
jgi:DNA gyrase inhibitor GyrI